MIEYEVHGLEELKAKLGDSLAHSRTLSRAIGDLIRKATLFAQGQVQQRTPVNTGRLRASMAASYDPGAMPLWGKVSTAVFYAPYVELGTRPHFPPPGALDNWAAKHGIPSGFLVARAIARRGTKAHEMFKRGFEATQGKMRSWLDEATRQIEGDFKQ